MTKSVLVPTEGGRKIDGPQRLKHEAEKVKVGCGLFKRLAPFDV